MSKQLTPEEKRFLASILETKDQKELIQYLETLSMSVRAISGKPVDVGTVVSQLTDVKNIMERSRYPTYLQIQYQVWLRLTHAIYGDVAQCCLDVADDISEALISYKGGSREEWVEQKKHAGGSTEEQNIYLGREQKPETPQTKRHFWSRGPKPEHQELQD